MVCDLWGLTSFHFVSSFHELSVLAFISTSFLFYCQIFSIVWITAIIRPSADGRGAVSTSRLL